MSSDKRSRFLHVIRRKARNDRIRIPIGSSNLIRPQRQPSQGSDGQFIASPDDDVGECLDGNWFQIGLRCFPNRAMTEISPDQDQVKCPKNKYGYEELSGISRPMSGGLGWPSGHQDDAALRASGVRSFAGGHCRTRSVRNSPTTVLHSEVCHAGVTLKR